MAPGRTIPILVRLVTQVSNTFISVTAPALLFSAHLIITALTVIATPTRPANKLLAAMMNIAKTENASIIPLYLPSAQAMPSALPMKFVIAAAADSKLATILHARTLLTPANMEYASESMTNFAAQFNPQSSGTTAPTGSIPKLNAPPSTISPHLPTLTAVLLRLESTLTMPVDARPARLTESTSCISTISPAAPSQDNALLTLSVRTEPVTQLMPALELPAEVSKNATMESVFLLRAIAPTIWNATKDITALETPAKYTLLLTLVPPSTVVLPLSAVMETASIFASM